MRMTPEQKRFVLAHEREDPRETALRFARDDMPLLLAQITGRKMAEKKIPAWYGMEDIIYPPRLPLEQSSSELTARYKASLPEAAPNGIFADLTGGMGVDFSFLSPHFREAFYVEQDEELCRIAGHNFQLLGLANATVCCATAERFLQGAASFSLIYLDPSRRDNAGRKLFRIGDCSPDLLEIKPLLLEKSDRVLVKYSPMLDISLAVESLGCVDAVHVVSVDNECKELLFLLSEKAAHEPLFVAVDLKRSGRQERFTFTPAQEQKAVVAYADVPGRYLYEPNASILKAGAFKSVAEAYSLQKLHVNSHLYTSGELAADFPGRVFEVKDFFVANKKNIKAFSREVEKANITVRNFPASVADIRLKTGLREGGDTYLFATTLSGGGKVWIVCRNPKFRNSEIP